MNFFVAVFEVRKNTGHFFCYFHYYLLCYIIIRIQNPQKIFIEAKIGQTKKILININVFSLFTYGGVQVESCGLEHELIQISLWSILQMHRSNYTFNQF